MTTRRKRTPLTPEQVATYIHLGRLKVADTRYDPYIHVRDVERAMQRDAVLIAEWFVSSQYNWSEEKTARVLQGIVDIQKGPRHFYLTLLQNSLSPMSMMAAASWADRHSEGCFVDLDLGPETRDALYAALNPKLRLHKEADPKLALLDTLKFIFNGLTSEDPDQAFNL